MTAGLRIPTATYRLQLNRSFGFQEASATIDYLERLGISDIYASPILKAQTGSSHGYDVTDPVNLNPELGSDADFREMADHTAQAGLGLILDIVPNHMAASPENLWWRDFLQKGSDSPYARYFDTEWLDFGIYHSRKSGHRRFFDLGQFVGMRVELPEVFRETHTLIFRLVDSGAVTGLRIDHIDGLYDPLQYLRRLQQRLGGGFYIVVEKILSGDEILPEGWPVSGTTGYEFAARLNELFVDSRGINAIDRVYRKVTGCRYGFGEMVYRKKRQVIRELFAAEISALGQYFTYLAGNIITIAYATKALREVTACLPVYRTYIRSGRVARRDLRYLEKAIAEAKVRGAPEAALEFLRRVLLLDFSDGIKGRQRSERRLFAMRWQQLTGAVMAKGYEDTALYDYNRLVSLNEVGGNPASNGLSIEEFHRWVRARGRCWLDTLNTTSTHDSKRSEDVRDRIAVLSEMPGEWAERLHLWMEYNRSKKIIINSRPMPEANTEYLLYQTMLGAWPLAGSEVREFRKRLKAYMVKATREAKTHTRWTRINEAYEDALVRFIDAILEKTPGNLFLTDFLNLQSKVAFCGALNSLSQVLLKTTLPGVPDFYQGNELWDFSLVDPDNRRPVDFIKRVEMLGELLLKDKEDRDELLDSLRSNWRDGRIKMYVTYQVLHTRRENPRLFHEGHYLPLYASGRSRERIVAFMRRCGDSFVLAAAPRFFAGMSNPGDWPIGEVWGNDCIIMPPDSPAEWRNVFTGESIMTNERSYYLQELFMKLPVALLSRGL